MVDSAKLATDVTLIAKFVGVRNRDDARGSGYGGSVLVSGTIRTTDHFCDGGANNDCTLKDLPFPVGVNCGAAASPGQKANIELGQLEVLLGLNRAFAEGLLLP